MKNSKNMMQEIMRTRGLGLKFNPFRLRAGGLNDEELAAVFVGREDELKRLTRAAASRMNVFLHGTYGIGKSALLRCFLYRIAQLRDTKVAAFYTRFVGESEEDFLNAVAYALATRFKEENREAKSLYDKMTGTEVVEEKAAGTSVEAGLIFKGGGSYTATTGKHAVTELSNPHLAACVQKMAENKNYMAVIIGVDELDKRSPRDFNGLVMKTRYLLEYQASYIIIGAHSFLGMPAVSTQAGAFDRRIEVSTMSENELAELGKNYCKLAGNNPFEDEALEKLAGCSLGVPRVMVSLCGGVIDGAIDLGFNEISETNIDRAFGAVGSSIYGALTPAQRKVVDYIRVRGEELGAVDRRTEKDLSVTKSAVYQHIDTLLSLDAIVEVLEEPEGRAWRLNPAVAAYLKSRGVKSER